ncbi:hypothetical protein CROQUDRAFT_661183 [Cronartium quercuum f. sp. fusiforme G11]|uniref:Uncharacterized protein n=1 Tax=Cronartium quercuum f. sp. fusiforme G11 TaxID=708437 RepID=A0A9P6NG21_9BASI|nr:hypothetical protein CROQUDRAFT_661183 [Cronartium quercuum f. sp. fusiforme G11]
MASYIGLVPPLPYSLLTGLVLLHFSVCTKRFVFIGFFFHVQHFGFLGPHFINQSIPEVHSLQFLHPV